MPEDYNPLFTDMLDTSLFGLLLRKARRDAGYSSMQSFVNDVTLATGVNISASTMQRIESGSQLPDIVQQAAICITLWGEPFPKAYRDYFDMCLNPGIRSAILDGGLFRGSDLETGYPVYSPAPLRAADSRSDDI